jgi:hypothetical protein
VSSLPLWQWYPIPGTALSSVEPSPRPGGITGPRSKIDAWCGATLKKAGSVYMLGAAGGHGDYAGNEVNALALNTATPRWTQLRAPSDASAVINDTQFYLDRRPAATHTYNSTQFIDSINRMFVLPSPGMGWSALPSAPAGFPYSGDVGVAFSFNVSAGEWDLPPAAGAAAITSSNYPVAVCPARGDFTAALCVKHPISEDVYYSRNYGNGIWRWIARENRWIRVNEWGRNPWYAGAAIDPYRSRMLLVGGYGSGAPEVRGLDGAVQSVFFGGLGASALQLGGHPGVVYDDANDVFLVFFNSGTSISMLRVNASTLVVDRPSLTGAVPAARANGIHNAVQYVAELRGIVVANSYTGNVMFMRTST